ncbi:MULTISPECIES: hypothetical protein [Sulfolobaceae]|uniref:Uncharacterized protein n=3 Tax=Sulfurisphaera TaxID=69655 RepID=Q976J4_SULTO|nr:MULTISPECIES: hypothetical protein [Sulfolobaceae]MBB5253264.1 hypothetical protein [Sulfurisphaera ohwakuensis]QGR15832.1 hypothetical protein D1869_00455 [Sulfurisphaera ohwakuensis]QIW23030.1 hypothetical protein EWF20_01895 [Sulfolobus sp. S-194]BAB65153.1 hypothetical protein STK_01960 [Sulfurisphaera tokodaii str. 7]HII74314.1 hypothetical protein [Sulfurisphaera tokodaii]
MSITTDELKKFLEEKIADLKKELEFYEYLLSLIEAEGYKGIVKGNKGSMDVLKSSRGEILAEIYYMPPIMRVIIKGKTTINKIYVNVLTKILENEKNRNKIDYDIVLERDELKEIIIKNVKDEIIYNKIKAALQSILERVSY